MRAGERGLVGAPCRKPTNAAANSGSDIAGIAVRHTCRIARPEPDASKIIQAAAAASSFHRMMPATRSTGREYMTASPSRASRLRPRQMQADQDGRRRERQRHRKLQIETHGLCIAVMTSGLTPNSVKNIRSETGAAASNASASTKPTGRARTLSAASVRMS